MRRLLPLISLAIALTISTESRADSKSAEAALKEQGLKRNGVNFCVPEEQQLAKILKDARAMQKDLLVVERELLQVEEHAANAKQYVQECFQRRAALTRQLTNARNVKEHNQMVAAINELEAEIVRLENGEEMKKAVDSARAAAAGGREKYVQALLDARSLVGKTEAQYKLLADDSDVTALIAEFNEGQPKEYGLGPSRGFAASVKALAKLEEKVLSEEIPLRREGGLFFVAVVFNGEASNTHEMAIDTGASIVSLPYALAKAVGLEPDENSELMQMSMADGSIVPGRKVFAKEIRVGKFKVENVECVVMPAELPNAAPLLGQTFLDKFGYKIDSDQQKLVMSKVEAEKAAPKRGARKERATKSTN
ncbi:MAG: retropepsin-like aspartic protease [Planctomycetia bacterium]|nr:retropepsin-like aspartic protease [Planctomycetia bacterium]